MISVTGRRNSDHDIVVRSSSAATKTSTPLIDTPEAVSAVSREQMDLQNTRNVAEALRYSSGVSASPAGDISRYDLVSIRGFGGAAGIGADEYLDGLKLFNGAYVATQQIDTYLLDQIDILKGPPSVLYGQSNPGGVVALTSKLPTDKTVRALSLESGSYDYVRGTADFGGALDAGGHLLYRLAATGTSARTQDLHTRTQRLGIMPSAAWVPNDRVNLTVTGFYQTDPRGGDYGLVPPQGSFLPNPNGRLSPHFYAGDDSYEQFSRQQAAIGYQLRYRLSPAWTFRSTARYAHVKTRYEQVFGYGLDPDEVTLERFAGANQEAFDTMTVEEQLLGRVDTGVLHHALLLGVNWQSLRDAYNYFSGAVPSIDIFAPDNGQAIPAPPLANDYSETTNQEAVFAEDQLSLGRLHGQVGAREDWSNIGVRNHLGGPNQTVTDRAFTWRAGILYAFPDGLSPYFNYSRSFQPITQLPQSGAPFKPSRGEQEEVGLKYSPKSFDGFFTAALFNLQETNVLVANPVNPLFSVQTGGVKSQGVELEAHANVTRGFSAILSYSYLHEIYNRGSGTLNGERPIQIPAQAVSAWGRYQFHDGALRTLGVSFGVRYVGNTVSDPTLEYVTPSYTLFDAEADYDLGGLDPRLRHTTIQITAQNLTNERYVSSCLSAAFGCYWGLTRNIIGKVSYQW